MYLASLKNNWSSSGSPSISRLKFKTAGLEFCSMSIRDGLLKCALSINDGSLCRSL